MKMIFHSNIAASPQKNLDHARCLNGRMAKVEKDTVRDQKRMCVAERWRMGKNVAEDLGKQHRSVVPTSSYSIPLSWTCSPGLSRTKSMSDSKD